ncbi:MAG TPA: potassium-transporting ATPase subunit KdpA [Segetibacter sp.]|jgi:K+-transporting ATPase ATPase A chain
MNTEILGVVAMFLITLVLAIPLGKYIAKVYGGEKTWLDPIFNPLDRLFFKTGGIKPGTEMTWKQHLLALLTINIFWFIIGWLILANQGWLPLNPDGNPSMSPDLAFNTAVSFLVNCNLQHYSGETGASYLTQIVGLMFLHFVTAGTGMAAAAAVFNALKNRTTDKLGNFYNYFIKSCTRILLPLAIVISLILVFNGSPMTMEGKDQFISMQGDTVNVSCGPVAPFVAIKHLGTNGGGFFGANSAHPLENPNYITNITQMVAQMIIPFALIFAFGYYTRRKKLAKVIFGVMTLGFLLLVIPTILQEMGGNPAIARIGADISKGNMEGKEVRFGSAASAYWSIATTVISTGSVNSMHDSYMPISGMNQMLAMMTNAFYGGVGVGFLNFFIFIIVAVFISGLMVGRTPELLGKKVEAKEMKIAMIIALLHPFLILVGTALSAYFVAHHPDIDWTIKPANWLNNPGSHGFSEMLYEYTSSSANNGSGFEGLGDNNIFWNVSTGIVMILGRFLPIIGPLAIAGILANKKFIPESAGTLKTDTSTFGIVVFVVIVIVAALSFFPALTLGPLSEYFSSK